MKDLREDERTEMTSEATGPAAAAPPEPPAGADPVRAGARHVGDFLRAIEPFFHRRAITYVDVGAHKGDVFREIVEHGPRIRRAHLIEPNPASFAALEATVAGLGAADRTVCLNRAVSDAPGTVTLRDADTMTRIVAAGGEAEEALPGRTFEVEAITLDALAAEFDRPQVSLLKIDVEGHETAVLDGAHGLLAEQAVEMIYVEAGMNPAGGQQTYYREIEDRLAAHGYRLFRIFEQKHEWREDSPFLRRVNLAFMSPRFAAAHPYRLCSELLALRRENEALKRSAGLDTEVVALRAAAAAATARLADAEKRQLADAESLKARFRETAALTAKIELARRDREAEAHRLKELDRALAAERKRAERLRGEREEAREAARAAAEEAEKAARAAERLRGEREEARAAARAAAEEAEKAAAAAQGRAEKAEVELAALRDYGRKLEARHKAVLQSHTWRAMEPVRRLLRLVRGRKALPAFAPRLGGGSRGNTPQAAAKRKPKPQPKAGKAKPARPGAEVARYVHHLWGGLAGPSVRELSRVMQDPAYPEPHRFTAAHQLATWHAFSGDTDAALREIRAVDRVAPRHRDDKLRWMKEGFILQARGETEAARAAFAAFLATPAGRDDPEASLALANGMGDDAARMAQINRVLERAGLAPLELVDTGAPLGIGNIRARAAPHGGGLGRVSVIVPAYAAAQCIGTALRSLSEQSYPDLEILVVEDASPDDTAAVVEQWASRDPRIRLIRQAENGGAYAARNRGLEEATGDFVTTHDTDDWSHPQKIALQLEHLAAHPQAAGICAHWVRVRADLQISPNWRIGDRLLHWNHSSFLIRRQAIDALGPWDPVRVGADTELIWRLQAAFGKAALAKLLPEAPLAFALDDDSSLTRTRATHVRTVYFGLRQIYRALGRHSHGVGDPEAAASWRAAALPPELSGDREPYALDFLLIGDCCDPGTVAEMRRFADGPEAAGTRIGLFHWPAFERPPAEFCPGYSELLARDGVRAVLPTARLHLARRLGIFFGTGHAEIDQFPAILDAAPAPAPS
jgi:FkbM family methyltransferase